MGIEVRTSSSAWTQYYDPEVFTSSGWQKILFGEIFTGTGPNNGWDYFYIRINIVNPVISLVSRTQTSITVNVTHSNPDSDLVRVYIYRVGNEANGVYYPNVSGTTGTINSNFTQSGLTLGTNYTFIAYAEYLDGSGNVIATSGITSQTYQTQTYNLYTPSVPTLTARNYQESGGVYSGTLQFTASSNPLYSQNSSVAYIQFQLTNGFGTTYTLNSSNLINNDSLQSRSVTFTGLGLGTQWICRARTVYTTISQQSDWSDYSEAATTVNWTRQYVPSQTNWTHLGNTSAYTGYTTSGTSTKSGSSTNNASSGTEAEWLSDPYTTTTAPVDESRNITSIAAFGTPNAVIEHDVSGTHNITNGSNGSTTVNTITYECAGAVFTNASFIIFEMTAAGASPGGNATIFNSGLTGVDGVTRSIASINFTAGIRQVRFNRGNVAEGQISATGILRLNSTSTVGGVTVNSLGGTSQLTVVDNNTFTRIDPSAPAGGILKTTASGTVTYQVQGTTQVPKGAGSETITLWAKPTGLPSDSRSVRLESMRYTHGGVGTSTVTAIVNGESITSRSVSADANFTSTTPLVAPNYTSLGGTGGDGWYVSVAVTRVATGAAPNLLYYSAVDEVQFRYSYEVLA